MSKKRRGATAPASERAESPNSDQPETAESESERAEFETDAADSETESPDRCPKCDGRFVARPPLHRGKSIVHRYRCERCFHGVEIEPGAVDPDAKDEEGKRRGLKCPACGCRHFTVVYTRPSTQDRVIRRRECRNCRRRISTVERVAGSA